jgi:hypothetical protein
VSADVSLQPPVVDASVEPEPVIDATSRDGPIQFCALAPDASCGVIAECIYEAFASDGGADWVFNREEDVVSFFKEIAVTSGACATYSTCTYDPLGPEPPDASPSNYVNGQNAFTAPDGFEYVITWFNPNNAWVVVRRDRNPTGYQLLVQYNECAGEGSRDQ